MHGGGAPGLVAGGLSNHTLIEAPVQIEKRTDDTLPPLPAQGTHPVKEG